MFDYDNPIRTKRNMLVLMCYMFEIAFLGAIAIIFIILNREYQFITANDLHNFFLETTVVSEGVEESHMTVQGTITALGSIPILLWPIIFL